MGKIIDRARERQKLAADRKWQRERYEKLDCYIAEAMAKRSEVPQVSVMRNMNEYQAALMMWGCGIGLVLFIAFFAYLIFFK